MKKLHQKRLAKLAIALLKSKRDIKFEMSCYSRNEEGVNLAPGRVMACGTSCCFLGFAPFVFPAVRKLKRWGHVCEWVIDAPAFGDRWIYLFKYCWPDDPKAAGARALWFLQNLESDKPYPTSMRIKQMKLSVDEIVKELETYLK